MSMMKKLIYTIAFTLAGLVGMAQTNQPLPSGAVPFGATTYLSPLDSTIWFYKERDGTAIKVANWVDVDSLFGLGYTKGQVDSVVTGIDTSIAVVRIDEGNGIGYTRSDRDAANYGPIGFRAFDMSNSSVSASTPGATGSYSTAFGRNTRAAGESSSALGDSSRAIGLRSTAIGYDNLSSAAYSMSFGVRSSATGQFSRSIGYYASAPGMYSTAIGTASTASGTRSVAIGDSVQSAGFSSFASGNKTRAIGSYSTAIGRESVSNGPISGAIGFGTKSNAYAQVSIGAYNDTLVPVQTGWIAGHPLFVVGNGTGDSGRSNAYAMYNNGNSEQFGRMIIRLPASTGTPTLYEKMMTVHSTTTGAAIALTRTSASEYSAILRGYASSGVQMTLLDGGVDAAGAYTNTSDSTIKNIITHDWSAVDSLPARAFTYKDNRDSGRVHVGYIAQEVREYLPDAVYESEETGLMSVDHVQVLIAKLAILEEKVKQLEARLEELEN